MRAIPRALTTDAIQEVLQTGAALTISEIIAELNRQGFDLPSDAPTYHRIYYLLDRLSPCVFVSREPVTRIQVEIRQFKRYALPVEA